MENKDEAIHLFESGAVRKVHEADEYAYTLIPKAGLDVIARRFYIGAQKYGKNNWKQGLPLDNVLNHLIYHVWCLLEGIPDKDDSSDYLGHLGAIGWAVCVLAHYYVEKGVNVHEES